MQEDAISKIHLLTRGFPYYLLVTNLQKVFDRLRETSVKFFYHPGKDFDYSQIFFLI
jgi:hypothetical protein